MRASLLVLLILLLASCKHRVKPVARDLSITSKTSYNTIFFDSALLDHFLDSLSMTDKNDRQEFQNFYRQRNYQFAWIDSSGIAEQARSFINLQGNFISKFKDSSLYDKKLVGLFDTLAAEDFDPEDQDSLILHTEFSLTAEFFKYASKVYKGSSIDAKELGWFIPKKKLSVSDALDSLIANASNKSEHFEPLNKQYHLMEDQLVKYYELERNNDWKKLVLPLTLKKLKAGDSLAVIGAIKKRLQVLGDLATTDTTHRFNKELAKGLKSFQQRFGLAEDGVIGAGVIKQLNVTPAKRIEQLLINLERVRWMPAEPAGDFIMANIPEFKLHVYEQGKYNFSMNVVVGNSANNTVIFTGDLKYIVFSPYWNVPPDILNAEVLPGIKNKANYLARNRMEIAGYTGKIPNIRQKPGANNSLGRVKFLFPNSYNIYLHDTPFKDRFNAAVRTFSHGCIRLSEPFKLAKFLLRNDKKWSDSTIKKAMYKEVERHVTLPKAVPVYITYFTAWVDREGRLNFRDDVYGHDKKMAEKLFVKL